MRVGFVRIEAVFLSIQWENKMQEQPASKDQENLVRPFARLNARLVSQEEMDRFGYIEGMKVGYVTTSAQEPEFG